MAYCTYKMLYHYRNPTKRASKEEGWSWCLYCVLKGNTLEKRKGNNIFHKSVQANQMANPSGGKDKRWEKRNAGKSLKEWGLKDFWKEQEATCTGGQTYTKLQKWHKVTPPKDSKGEPGEKTLSPNHRNTESCKFERRPREKAPSFSRGIFVFQFFVCFTSYFVGSEFPLLGQLSCFTLREIWVFFFLPNKP